MYELNSAKTLKIGISGNADSNIQELFQNLLNDNILEAIKICQNFNLQTEIIPENTISYQHYNFIFYVTTLTNLYEQKSTNGSIDNKLLTDIQKMSNVLTNPRNHLFIIVDGCENMEIDDDGDLILSDKKARVLHRNFEEKISEIIDDNLFHIHKMSIIMANIWKLISDDSSIVNLTEDQIDKLSSVFVAKSAKMALADKKRAIRTALKKTEINDKIAETGYSDLFNAITQYFKLIHQKKMVCQNYVLAFDNINIGIKATDMKNINNLIKETYDISYLKTEMYDDLIDKIDNILLLKLKSFYDKSKNHIAIDSTLLNSIDAHEYHCFLSQIMELSNGYNLSNIKAVTKKEMDKINNVIIDYHNKEVEKITDLEKISNFLEIFANNDKNNLSALFEKIKSHPKIMSENIEKMDKWLIFINKCLKLELPKDSVIRLMEEIIMAKIAYYINMTKANGMEISTVYPQCLHVFLLSNLKHFVFKKLYMFISYSIRYSGRNIAELIKNLKPEQYQNLLLLETKLLELCSNSVDEQSQSMNLSDVNIVEIFNENNSKSKNPSKDLSNVKNPKKSIKHDNKFISGKSETDDTIKNEKNKSTKSVQSSIK